jgi:hypothetical protein
MEIHKAAELTSEMFLYHFYNADETGLVYLAIWFLMKLSIATKFQRSTLTFLQCQFPMLQTCNLVWFKESNGSCNCVVLLK